MNSIYLFFRSFIPPIIFEIIYYIRGLKVRDKNLILFNGDSELFISLIKNSEVYLEYGVGASTVYASRNTKAKIYSIDSSRLWINKVRNYLINHKIEFYWADIGEIGDWGRPINYDKRNKFSEYPAYFWKRGIFPDLILIDGCFRVSCFLTSLLYAKEGTHILFDDYNSRGYYHIVEDILSPLKIQGRQALFKVPKKEEINFEEIEFLLNKFEFIFD